MYLGASAEMETAADYTIEKAKLGVEAENFLSTSLGRYLLDRSEVEVERLMRELVDTPTENTDANNRIRNQIAVARQFRDWVTEAIAEGRIAHDELREREAYE